MIHAQTPVETIVKYIRSIKEDLFSGKYDKDIVIAVRLAKPFYRYKKTFAPARAAMILRKLGQYIPLQKIKFVYLSYNQVWQVGQGVPVKRITREGYEHIWQNRTMTWLLKLLQSFISPFKTLIIRGKPFKVQESALWTLERLNIG